MALARFDSQRQMEFAGVGNIEVRANSGNERIRFVAKRGVLGMQPVRVHAQVVGWNPEWLLVMHSDGLRSHWQWSDFPGIGSETAQGVAARLMRLLAGDHDDATVLAVKSRPL